MKRHEECLEFAKWWCSARGQELDDYYDHLGQGGPPDGLEVMLVLLAIDTRIEIIFSDTICTTAVEGIDFVYPTIVWATVGTLLCHVFDPEAGVAADIDTSCTSSMTPDEEHVPFSLALRNIWVFFLGVIFALHVVVFVSVSRGCLYRTS